MEVGPQRRHFTELRESDVKHKFLSCLRKMESDGDDLISSGSLFHDKGPSANFVLYLGQSVVDMIQIAKEVYAQLESSDGRVQICRMLQTHAKNNKQVCTVSIDFTEELKASVNEVVNVAEMRTPSYHSCSYNDNDLQSS